MVQASSSSGRSRILPMLSLALVLSLAFTALFSATTESLLASHSQCSDGIDNDTDGRTDYPQDDDCENLDDDFEGVGSSGNFITVTDGKESVSPGSASVYVITLKQQRDAMRNVNVSLHLPHQENITSASDGGNVTPGLVRWTNVTLHKNVTRTLTVNVNVDPNAEAGQYMVARALVEGAEATDTTLIENFVAQPADQYSVNISDGREFATPGQNLTYDIRVRNTSQSPTRTNVRVALPYDVGYLSASAGAVRDSFNVTWRDVSFAPNEEKTFQATVQVDPRAPDRSAIRARAYAGTVSDLDETVVRTGLPYDAITTSISDGRSTVAVGQTLTYTVKVMNESDVVGTHVAVNAGIPTYGELTAASHAGTADGNNVRWHIIQIAPGETRSFTYSVRVRPDTPLGTELTASAVADGMNGAISRDTTRVVAISNETGRADTNVLFRKTADRTEAVPGGSIRYTLFVRNTLDRAITDASILDRYDARYMSLVSTQDRRNLVSETPGTMEWNVPVLQPGESWQVSYVLSIARNAPNGLSLDNVASLRGNDVSSISLTERVRTNASGVMGKIPQTGAGMDAMFVALTALLAVVTTGAQKRLGALRLWA